MSHLKNYVQRIAASTDSFEAFKTKIQANEEGVARLKVLDSNGPRYGLMFTKLDDAAHHNLIEREAIGAIFDRDTHEMLCRTHPLMPEYMYDGTPASWDAIRPHLPEQLEEYVVRVYMEGTRMMVYKHRDEWCVSTCRVVDARQGRWLQGTKTFRDQMEEAMKSVGITWEDMDARYGYTFLVCSPDTAAVTPFTVPYLFLLAVMDRETGEFVPTSQTTLQHRVAIPSPVSVRSVQDMQVYLQSTRSVVPGIVASHVRTGESFKILHGEYVHARQLLGNSTSILRRVLELMKGPMETVKEFERTFPHLRKEVQTTRQRLYHVSRWLMDVYRAKYIRRCAPEPEAGNPVTFLPKPVHAFVADLYTAHKTHRENYSPAILRHMLLRLPTTTIEKILELSESSMGIYDLRITPTTDAAAMEVDA